MKVKRRIEIVTVREQTYRFSPTSAQEWCGICGSTAPMLTPILAATLSHLSLRTLFRWIESGDIHFVETPDGDIFLCLASVQAQANNPPSNFGSLRG
jgi:hypothetical protein